MDFTFLRALLRRNSVISIMRIRKRHSVPAVMDPNLKIDKRIEYG